MAVPKKKKSSSKGGMTRAHWHLKKPGWVSCPQCQEVMQRHRVCKACGFYRTKQVVSKSA